MGPVSNRHLVRYRMTNLYTIVVLLAIGHNTKGDEHEEAENRLKRLIQNRINATLAEQSNTETVQVCALLKKAQTYKGKNQVIKDYDEVHRVTSTQVINKIKNEGIWVVPMDGKYSVAYIEDVETEAGTAQSHCKVSLHRNYHATNNPASASMISMANHEVHQSSHNDGKHVETVAKGNVVDCLAKDDNLRLMLTDTLGNECKFQFIFVCIHGHASQYVPITFNDN